MKVAIIGAGASGLMAAVSAAQSADVTVYEKNQNRTVDYNSNNNIFANK